MRVSQKGSKRWCILLLSVMCCLVTVASASQGVRGLTAAQKRIRRGERRNKEKDKEKNNKNKEKGHVNKQEKNDKNDKNNKNQMGKPAETPAPTNKPSAEPTPAPSPPPIDMPSLSPTTKETPAPTAKPPTEPADPPAAQPTVTPDRPAAQPTVPPVEFDVPLKSFSLLLRGDLPDRGMLEETAELFLLDTFQQSFDFCQRVDLTEVRGNVADRHRTMNEEGGYGEPEMEVEYRGSAFFTDIPLPDQEVVWDLQAEALADTEGFEAALYTSGNGIVTSVQTKMGEDVGYTMEGIDPDPFHAMRVAGIFLFVLNLLVFVALSKLSRRRQHKLELKDAQRRDEYGGLVTQEGLDYLLSQGRVTENKSSHGEGGVSPNSSVRELDRHDSADGSNHVRGRSVSPTPFAVPVSVSLDYPNSVNFPSLASDIDGSELSDKDSFVFT